MPCSITDGEIEPGAKTMWLCRPGAGLAGDYSHMMRLQAVPFRAANMEMVRAAFHDLCLPELCCKRLAV